MINLNEKQVEQLSNLLLEIPTKYGMAIVNMLNSFIAENAKKEESKTLNNETIS